MRSSSSSPWKSISILPFVLREPHPHVRAQQPAQLARDDLERLRGGRPRRPLGLPGGEEPRQVLGLAHGQAVVDDPLRQLQPHGLVGHREDRARVTGGHLALVDQVLHLVGQIEQAQRVRDRRARLGDLVGQLGLRHLVLGEQLAVAARLFDRVQVLALQVLDERELERLRRRRRQHAHRHPLQARQPRGPPPPLTCDDLVALAVRTHDDRLEQAHLLDRVRELRDALFVDVGARLVRVGRDHVDGELGDFSGRLRLLRRARDERGQAAAEPPLRHDPSLPSPGSGRRLAPLPLGS